MDQINRIGSTRTFGAGDVLRILWRRSWIIILVIGASLGISYYVSKRTPARWKASQQLRLPQRGNTLVMSEQGLNNLPEQLQPDAVVAQLQSPSSAQRAIGWLKNHTTDAKFRRELDTMDAEDLRRAVTITGGKDSSMILVEAEGASRERAKALANGYCQAFLEGIRSEVQRGRVDSYATLETRTSKAHEQMLQAEQAEAAYKQSHQLADVSLQQSGAVKQLIDREANVASAKQEMQSATAKLRALGEQLKDADKMIREGTGVRDDSLVLGLQNQLSSLQIERAQAELKYTREFPGILPDLDKKIEDIQGRLQKAVQGTLDNKKPSLQAQGKLFEDYKAAQTEAVIGEAKFKSAMMLRSQAQSQTASIPQTSMEYERLHRNTEITSKLYAQLKSLLNQAIVNRNVQVPSVTIVNSEFGPYVPQDPFLPNRTRDLAFGGIIGLFLAILSVLLLEQSDNRLRNMDSARRIAPGPVVGALPRLSRSQMDHLMGGSQSASAIESYSLARANLALVHRQNANTALWNRQVVLITSAVPGEGKSLTAYQIAHSMARTGRQVILVDADMRRPTQNDLFNTDEPTGLADVLAGDMTLNEALVSSEQENLLVLHSGTPRQNPTDLVSTERMAATIAALRAEADVVVIDSPACSVVADALILAPYADCILHVIGAGQVDEDLVRETAAALQSASPKTLAFFVNRAPREKAATYSNYYRYTAPETQFPSLPALPAGTGAGTGAAEPRDKA